MNEKNRQDSSSESARSNKSGNSDNFENSQGEEAAREPHPRETSAKLIEKWADFFGAVKILTGEALKKVDEIAPGVVPGVIDELRLMARHPHTVSQWIEGRSPFLARKILGAASNWSEPFTMGMGFRIDRMSEDSVGVSMAGSIRNQRLNGEIHTGALAVLGEFASRMYWEYHLDLKNAEAQLNRIQVRVLAQPRGELHALFRLPVSEREKTMFRLRRDEQVEVDSMVLVYDRAERIVAEVESDWLLRKQKRIGAIGVATEN